MGEATKVFENAATAYAAFNLRDSYYPEMARFVINAVKARLADGKLGTVVDVGAGIGVSTMEILKDDPEFVIAVEPDESMRYLCGLNVMGDPMVSILDGRGEFLYGLLQTNFSDYQDSSNFYVGAVICAQVFHLFNPPDKESLVPMALSNFAKVLHKGGVAGFDLGPSNYEFAMPLGDHRSGNIQAGQIMTELGHPMYQRAHQIAIRVIREKFPDFDRENLWPPVTSRMSFKFLRESCENAGLKDLQVSEDFSPVSGQRVINFIRNGWSVFFRWGEPSKLPMEEKLSLMNKVLNELFHQSDFEAMKTVMSYHPTAVFTAIKA